MNTTTVRRAAEQRARRMNTTEQRLYLLDNGWTRDGSDKRWSHPTLGVLPLSQAVRVALAEEATK